MIIRNSPYSSITKSYKHVMFSSTAISEKDLLMKSIIPTNYFQKQLLRLPIPKVPDTLEEYELSLKALLDDTSFKKTQEHIQSFGIKEGPLLHSYLKKFSQKHKDTNYVNVLWTDRYLKDRSPVVLTHNPTMVLKNPRKSTGQVTQATRASNIIWSSVRYLRSLRENSLEPALFHMHPKKTDNDKYKRMVMRMPPFLAYLYSLLIKKVFPLDNSQLIKHLFNTTRIPLPEKDEIRNYENSNHILILHKGQMYIFDILDQDGRGVDPNQILSNILFILNQPPNPGYNEPGLGVLTTMNRSDWAAARNRLVSLGNEGVLHKVDSAVFAMALDSDNYETVADLIENTLHGSAENRWFDKSFSVIIDGQGDAAINMEHSWGDGMAMVNYMDSVFKDSESSPYFNSKMSNSDTANLPSPKVEKLTFHLDSSITDDILPKARNTYNDWRAQLELNLSHFDKMGNKDIIEAKANKDSLLQLSFQMAHYKMYGKQAATYESASSISYKDGRTETLRPATLETKAFCEFIEKNPDDLQELQILLRKCAKRHNTLIVKCSTGKGWDRHLFGLKTMAEMNGFDPMPNIFTDPSYKYINDIVISTSTVPSDALESGAFAAVTRDGYGLGYGTREHECGCIVTTWKGSSYSKGSQFVQAHIDSLKQLSKVIEYAKKHPVAK